MILNRASCAKGLATRGDLKEEVLQECGKPVAKHSAYKKVRGSRMYVEEWVYNFGPNEFMQAINFDSDGKSGERDQPRIWQLRRLSYVSIW